MFNTDDYRHLTDQIIKKVNKDGIESISEFAALTGIPLLCQYEIVMEELPEHKEYCLDKIRELKEFFGL